jgi:hypothetical protein
MQKLKYELIRNAKVRVSASKDSKNFPIATITVNGIYTHTFDPESRVSRNLETMDVQTLQNLMTGGTYFFVEGVLVDFRYGNYNGFVHEDESIKQLVKVIGIVEAKDLSTRLQENLTSNKYSLGASWSKNEIHVPEYNDGGEFKSELLFGWNPFVKTVNSAFMLWRLICENGMRGVTSFLNTKIPLINRWEEHLDIANVQIQNKVDGMVKKRLAGMGDQYATVAELQQIATHARKRFERTMQGENAHDQLRTIIQVADPSMHLANVYRENVFKDKRLSAQVPGHLSLFDAYNLATEIRTHTKETDGSSALALDRMANDFIFNHTDLTQHASRFVKPRDASFDNHEKAFFGKLN